MHLCFTSLLKNSNSLNFKGKKQSQLYISQNTLGRVPNEGKHPYCFVKEYKTLERKKGKLPEKHFNGNNVFDEIEVGFLCAFAFLRVLTATSLMKL